MGNARNAVHLFGRLTKDIYAKDINTKNGQMRMGRFSLAVNRRGKDAGADFINCAVYGKGCETMEKWCHKGSLIVVDGHIQTGSYTAQDGHKVYTTDVIVDEFVFGESRNADQNNSSSSQNNAPQNNSQAPANDVFAGFQTGDIPSELPFQ